MGGARYGLVLREDAVVGGKEEVEEKLQVTGFLVLVTRTRQLRPKTPTNQPRKICTYPLELGHVHQLTWAVTQLAEVGQVALHGGPHNSSSLFIDRDHGTAEKSQLPVDDWLRVFFLRPHRGGSLTTSDIVGRPGKRSTRLTERKRDEAFTRKDCRPRYPGMGVLDRGKED
jgi:hypothetical protein